MPRPRKCRLVQSPPRVDYFKPRGVPLSQLNERHLSIEGLEALRLCDLMGVPLEEAAAGMQVSRHTLGRVLAEARRVVAAALVEGCALRIGGGDYRIAGCARQAPSGPGCAAVPPPLPGAAEGLAEGEDAMGKIAVSSEGPTLDDMVDPRFGRAAGFVVVEADGSGPVYQDNGASQTLAQGAGIQAAQTLAAAGVKVVLTGYVGPKAFQALRAVGIQVGQDLGGVTVRQALERYRRGLVAMAQAPNRQAGGR